VKQPRSTESGGLVKSVGGAILQVRPLSGPDAAGAVPEAQKHKGGACGGPASHFDAFVD